MEKYRIAIVIPAFNEAFTIERQVERLSTLGNVIVVNDGSTDETSAICSSLQCTLINLHKNSGYDHALEVGIKRGLDYDFIITTDADGQIPVECVAKVIKQLNTGADLVLGVRNYFPRLAERIINKLIKNKYGVSDIFCGLKGYKVEALNAEISMGDSIGTRLAFDLLKKKATFATVDVTIEERLGESRFGDNGIKTNLKLLGALKHV